MSKEMTHTEIHDGKCGVDIVERDSNGNVVSHEQYSGHVDWKGDIVRDEKTGDGK